MADGRSILIWSAEHSANGKNVFLVDRHSAAWSSHPAHKLGLRIRVRRLGSESAFLDISMFAVPPWQQDMVDIYSVDNLLFVRAEQQLDQHSKPFNGLLSWRKGWGQAKLSCQGGQSLELAFLGLVGKLMPIICGEIPMNRHRRYKMLHVTRRNRRIDRKVNGFALGRLGTIEHSGL